MADLGAEMKPTDTSGERAATSLDEWRSGLIRGSCYVIFGLNEAIFCRKSLASKELPLWLVPNINKSNGRNDLRPIMVGGHPPGFCNLVRDQEMRPRTIPVFFSAV